MKFLVDAQLPKRLALMLRYRGYDAIHTLELPEQNRTPDHTLNDLSIRESRILISKDMDFVESILLTDRPYKLLFVHTGNIMNKQLTELFVQHFEDIVTSFESARLVELQAERLIIHDLKDDR